MLKAVENWIVLTSWESKPVVASIPMQQMNKYTYRIRRFGFLYHGTLSSAIKRVRMGSDVPSLAPKIPIVDKLLGKIVRLVRTEELVHQVE